MAASAPVGWELGRVATAASRHRLGFAVKVLGGGGLPSHDTRRWSSGPHLRCSLQRLSVILDYLHDNDIRMYRFASGLAPYASHPELPQFHDQVRECEAELAALGVTARKYGIRLSSHPGQYTVLNSEDAAVQSAAIAELEVQAALLDGMGTSAESVVVLHVGGCAGGRKAAFDRFQAGWERLSPAAQNRLVIENDDRSFSLADVLEVAQLTGARVVWDPHHHHCHDPHGIPDAEALMLALATWRPDTIPKVHYSSPRLDVQERKIRHGRRVQHQLVLPQLRAHADLVDPIGFERFLREVACGRDFDVMLEAKAKDLALLRLREQLAARGFTSADGRIAISKSEATTGIEPV